MYTQSWKTQEIDTKCEYMTFAKSHTHTYSSYYSIGVVYTKSRYALHSVGMEFIVNIT